MRRSTPSRRWRREAPSDVAARAYGGQFSTSGSGPLIPNPFDPRLILRMRAGSRPGSGSVRRRARVRSSISPATTTGSMSSYFAPASS